MARNASAHQPFQPISLNQLYSSNLNSLLCPLLKRRGQRFESGLSNLIAVSIVINPRLSRLCSRYAGLGSNLVVLAADDREVCVALEAGSGSVQDD